MNIERLIAYLNQEKGYALSAAYYQNVQTWEAWWRGFYKPFHEFKELSGKTRKTRQLYSLRMAKKVCEDWASILLNEKTRIVIDDPASSRFLQGSEEEPGGVFAETDFWGKGNALIEKAFYSGTGAILLRAKQMQMQQGHIVPDRQTKLCLDFLPAGGILPLTVREGKIVEAAFASEVLVRGEVQIYLQIHEQENDGYRITNAYLLETNGQLQKRPLPEGMVEQIHTGSGLPWFVIVGPNIVNNIEGANGLGISVYANAIDNLKGVDLAYNNFNRDFHLGGKKVFYTQEMVQYGEDGKEITPDDVCQQLFVRVGDEVLSGGEKALVQEFNPQLRVQDNRDGLQAQLDYLSFKCGLGTKHYQFNAGQVVTATQYMGDKQELIQNASKHYIVVEKAVQDLVRVLLWAGKALCGAEVDPHTGIKVQFDDSYIIDKESERLRDQQEVRDGLMQRWEYRVKWYGESEEEAKAAVQGESALSFGGEQ